MMEKYSQDFWAEAAPWGLFGSDVVLEVSVIITEPACREATIRFELPERARLDIIARSYGDTIEEAIKKVSEKAVEVLAKIVEERRVEIHQTLKFGDDVVVIHLPREKALKFVKWESDMIARVSNEQSEEFQVTFSEIRKKVK